MTNRKSDRLSRSRNGMILGVCQGIADWSGVNVWVWRTIAVILLFSTSFWACTAIYLLAALLMPQRY